MTFDLTPISGRTAGMKRWWCSRRGHKPVVAVITGWWTPALGRIREQRIAATGELCDRCNVWLTKPAWPSRVVHPAFVRDLQLTTGAADGDVVGWVDDVARWPSTRHR